MIAVTQFMKIFKNPSSRSAVIINANKTIFPVKIALFTKRKGRFMKKVDLIRLASSAYPDDMIYQAYKRGSGKVGDGLADFIVAELICTYCPGASTLTEAKNALSRVVSELLTVIAAIERKIP